MSASLLCLTLPDNLRKFKTVTTSFIHQVILTRLQREGLSVFESRCHLPTCLQTRWRLGSVHFNAKRQARKMWIAFFYNLCFSPTENRTHVYHFVSLRSIHSTDKRKNEPPYSSSRTHLILLTYVLKTLHLYSLNISVVGVVGEAGTGCFRAGVLKAK